MGIRFLEMDKKYSKVIGVQIILSLIIYIYIYIYKTIVMMLIETDALYEKKSNRKQMDGMSES